SSVSLVPPTDRYPGQHSLPIAIDGVSCDVLSFNPQAARQLLLKIGKPLPVRMEFSGGNFPDTRLVAQVLQRQWREHLGIDLTLVIVDVQSWLQSVWTRSYRH